MAEVKLEDIPKIGDDFYYIACPYGSAEPELIEERMRRYEILDAQLSSLGHLTFSPLDKHYKLHHMNLPGDYGYWKRYCRAMLLLSKGLIVLTLNGWDKAPGVRDEIEFSKYLDRPVYYV